MPSKLALLIGVAFSTGALAGSPLGAERSYLSDLPKKHEITVSDFDYPFLISQTAVLSSLSAAEAGARIEKHLRKPIVDLSAHGKDGRAAAPFKLENIRLPKGVVVGDQLEAIQTCKLEKCQMKLQDSEKPSVEKSANKVAEYQRLIRERVRAYLAENKLAGYEDRASNESFVRKMIGAWPFLAAKYPDVAKYFSGDFWKKLPPPPTFTGAFIKQELIPFGLSRLQPIYRIGEVFAFNEPGGRVFFEMHVYSDHYFDSSLRMWEIIPAGTGSQVIVTDIMEIDELTKSGFVRFLYQSEMESAIRRYQHEELGGIDGLVSASRVTPRGNVRYAQSTP